MQPAHEGLTVAGKHGPRWTGEVRFLPERLEKPLRWKKPRGIFVNSMSDLFHEAITHEQRAAVFCVMAMAPRHTFQVLTKRPDRALEFLVQIARGHGVGFPGVAFELATAGCNHGIALDQLGTHPWPLPNVWLGVSVEDQTTADERIPVLLDCPAAVRWVSYEPALGPVDFARFLEVDEGGYTPDGYQRVLDWIVVGGESGPGARPFDLGYAYSTIAQCKAAGVACFVKQLGAKPYEACSACEGGGRIEQVRPRYPGAPERGAQWGCGECGATGTKSLRLYSRKGADLAEWSEDLRVQEMPCQ
jgi:protein gp37